MEPNPRTPDAVLLNASMEARVTLRVEPAGYVSPESASRALEEATRGLHVTAATALAPVAIKRAYAKVTAAMETLVGVAVHEAKKTRAAERERAFRAGKKVPRGKKLDDEEEDADDKEEKAARKRLDPRTAVNGAAAIPGEEEGDANAGGLTPLARACGRPVGPRAAAIVRALLDLGADPAERSGSLSWTPLHHAAACGAVDAAAALCRRSKKAHPRARIIDDVDATDRDGFTPLHVAVVGGHLDVVRLLLGPGLRASTTQRSGPGGYNALHWAARAGIRACSRRCETRPARRRRRSERGRRWGTEAEPSSVQRRSKARIRASVQIRASFPVRRRFTSRRVTAASARYASCCGTPRTRARRWRRETARGEPRSPPPPPRASTRRCPRWRGSSGSRRTTGTGTGTKSRHKSRHPGTMETTMETPRTTPMTTPRTTPSRSSAPSKGVFSFSALEWSAYDARAETVRATARCGGHTRRDYERAARVAKTRRAKGPVLRLLSRGRE